MDFLQDWVAVQIKGWNWRSHYIVAKAHGQCNGLVLDILRYCSYIYIYICLVLPSVSGTLLRLLLADIKIRYPVGFSVKSRTHASTCTYANQLLANLPSCLATIHPHDIYRPISPLVPTTFRVGTVSRCS